jgi:ribosomal protein S18 acetylase RimI-like enzyme
MAEPEIAPPSGWYVSGPKTIRRARMELDLDATPPPACLLPLGYRFAPWDREHLAEAAAMEHRAYRGGIDAQVFPKSLGSADLCERHLTEVLASEDFAAPLSMLVMLGPRVVGHLQASQSLELALCREGVEPGCALTTTAFVCDIAVDPDHQGGLGRALLREHLARCIDAGIKRTSLWVTSENRRASALYASIGFQETEYALSRLLEESSSYFFGSVAPSGSSR